MRALLLSALVACSQSPAPTGSPRLDVRVQPGGGYTATLVNDGVEQTLTARTLDAELGTAIGARLSKPELIICGEPAIPLADLQRIAMALPKSGSYVVCLPDRKNCPGSCP